MYMYYVSKKKILYRILSIGLIILIGVFSVASIPNDKTENSQVNNMDEVNNTDTINIMDDEIPISGDIDIELDTPENVDGAMDDSIEVVTSTEKPEDNKESKVNENSKEYTNTKVTSSPTEKTKTNTTTKSDTSNKTSSSDKESTRDDTKKENATEQRQRDQLFIARVYSLNNVIGKKVYIKLTGTKNAYTDGVYKYKNKYGKYVEENWSTELNSSGSGTVTIEFPEGASDPQFHILWAGVWNETKTVALAKECSMVSYESK